MIVRATGAYPVTNQFMEGSSRLRRFIIRVIRLTCFWTMGEHATSTQMTPPPQPGNRIQALVTVRGWMALLTEHCLGSAQELWSKHTHIPLV